MKRLIFICLFFLVVSSFSNSLIAKDTESTKDIGTIVVTATRTPQPLKTLGNSVSVITEEDIKRYGIESVQEALRLVPGINVSRSGGKGQTTSVRIRGGESDHLVVLRDGMRIKSTTLGYYDFGYLPVDNIEKIEIVRGPVSTLYGPDAVSGVVNIITKKSSSRNQVELDAENGSYSYERYQIGLAGLKDRFSFSTSLSRIATDGDLRNQYWNNNAFSIGSTLSFNEKLNMNFSGNVIFGNHGVSGQDKLSFDINDRAEVEELQLTTSADYMFTPKISAGINVGYFKNDAVSIEPPPDGIIQTQTSTASSEVTSDIVSTKLKLDFRHNPLPSVLKSNIFSVGIEWERQKGKNYSLDPSFINSGSFYFLDSLTSRAVFIEDNLNISDRIFLQGGVRWDKNSEYGTNWLPHVAASIHIPWTKTILKGSWGRAFKAPTINELVFPNFGSDNLKAERSRQWDAGIIQPLFNDKLSLSATYFQNKVIDMITFTTISLSPIQFGTANTGRVKMRGWEFGLTLEPAKWAKLVMNYTRLSTLDINRGEPLRRRPKNSGSFSFILSPVNKLNISLTGDISGDYFDDDFGRFTPGKNLAQNRGMYPGHKKIDMKIAYDITKNLRIYTRGENILDENYMEAAGFPSEGRTLYVGFKTNFNY